MCDFPTNRFWLRNGKAEARHLVLFYGSNGELTKTNMKEFGQKQNTYVYKVQNTYVP